MEGRQMLLIRLLLAFLFVVSVRGKTVTYDWTVDYAFRSPDCVEKLVINVNGLQPGPLIRAAVGDTVVVNLDNRLTTEGVVIHWHGILQQGTPWADGAAFISQCPINPGETYIYKFKVTQAGTFLWHGHFGMQRAAGFYGQIIVDPTRHEIVPFKYDDELNLIIGDWWHHSMYEQELGLDSVPFRWVQEPQSLLLNGKGAYNCSLITANANDTLAGNSLSCNSTKCAPAVLAVEPGKTYRLRISSVASLSSLNFILEGHTLTVVEVSGHYVEPVVVQDLDVYSGETFSVLFTANQDPSHNYWAAINVRGRKPGTPPGLAVLNYLPNPATNLPTTPAPVSPVWNDFPLSLAAAQKYKAAQGYVVPLPKQPSTRHIFLLNTQNKLAETGQTRWAVSNVSYVPTKTPVIAALKYGLRKELGSTPPDFYESNYNISIPPPNPNTTLGSGVYIFKLGEVVDVILQNANTLTVNNSEIHPWHLHGHDFWVLGYGFGKFDASRDYANLNYENPPLVNTAPVFPLGWTVLRFVANNPGAWPFHCHVEPHFHLGMGVVFAEGIDQIPAIPAENLGCGATKFLH